jgi:hypothetical protein
MSFSIRVPAGYQSSPTTGTAVVAGAGTNISLAVTRVKYPVVFTESGLPFATSWSITFNGSLLTSNNTTAAANVPNGTYPYIVSGVAGFQASPSSGSVVVFGSARSISIGFSQVTYVVSFIETGVPSTTCWSFAFNSGNYTTNRSQLNVLAPNGSYGFQVFPLPGYSESPSSGAVRVNGQPVTQMVTFTEVSYPLFVNVSGLPAGLAWNLTVDGVRTLEHTDAVVLREQNGTHPLQVGPVAGYVAASSRFTVSVEGRPSAVAVVFAPFTFGITFAATGLPAGTRWSVLLAAKGPAVNNSSTGTLLSFNLPNGSASFTVSAPWGFVANPDSGSFKMGGSPLAFLISFRAIPGYVTGTVDPPGATVTINGTTVLVTNGAFNVSLGPGNYTVRATASGYAPWTENFTIAAGNRTAVPVSMHPLPLPGSTSPVDSRWVEILAVSAIAGLIVVAVVTYLRRSPPRR